MTTTGKVRSTVKYLNFVGTQIGSTFGTQQKLRTINLGRVCVYGVHHRCLGIWLRKFRQMCSCPGRSFIRHGHVTDRLYIGERAKCGLLQAQNCVATVGLMHMKNNMRCETDNGVNTAYSKHNRSALQQHCCYLFELRREKQSCFRPRIIIEERQTNRS